MTIECGHNKAFVTTRAQIDAVEEGIRARKTHAQIAAEIDKTRSRVSNLARLLDLPRPVLAAVRSGKLAPKTAEALLTLRSEERIIQAFRHVAAHRLSAEKTREWVRGNTGETSSADIHALESRMSEALNARVTVSQNGDGYVIAIHASDLDCIDGVIERLGIEL